MAKDSSLLTSWQRQCYPALKHRSFGEPSRLIAGNLTLLAYFFWDDERLETEFWRIEFSFLCAFRVLGVVKAILVVNETTAEIRDFCRRYQVEIQVEPNLSHGGLKAMCADCCGKLHTRFTTDYVLIIQNDGIVVNPGIESFIGKYDYVGAPWPGHVTYYDWFPYPRFGVGNGGLSLRSRRIAAAVSKCWHAGFKRLPYCFLTIEDNFYCKTLALMPKWRRQFKFPDIRSAAGFSIDTLRDYHPPRPPMGFHSADGFANYCEFYGPPQFSDDQLTPVSSTVTPR